MFCARVKEFLSQKGVLFKERDVAQDPQALSELEALGVMTTPVTVIGEEVIVGFDRARLEQLLGE
ncbi:MAG: glutaredoxin family protein [Anaerolineae bacterium]